MITIENRELGRLAEPMPRPAFSPDARTLVAPAGPRTIRFWDVASGKEMLAIDQDARSLQSVLFAPNGKTIAWKDTNDVGIWDVVNRKTLSRLTAKPVRKSDHGGMHFFPLRRLAFSPDGAILASGAEDDTICLWEVASGKQLRNMLVAPEAGFNCLAFSPDGNFLVAGEGAHYSGSGSRFNKSSLSLWEVATGKRLVEMKGHEQPVRAVAFSPDGRTVVSCSEDGTIRLWEAATGLQLLQLGEEDNEVHDVAFSPDGKTIASAMDNGTALLWDVAPLFWNAPTNRELTTRQFEELWLDLIKQDGPKVFRAIWSLSASPIVSPRLLRERLQPVQNVPLEEIRQLVTDLDAIQFAVREAASKELSKILIQAEPELRKALAETKSEEVRSRIEPLLKPLDEWIVKDPETLRTLRAIWVLERIGTPQAQALLETLAQGAPPARVTQDAKAALARLKQKK
jgi:hypothetical protein